MKRFIAGPLLVLAGALVPPPTGASENAVGAALPNAGPRSFISEHRTAGDDPVPYQAIAEEIWLADYDGSPEASIFSISYTKIAKADLSARPVIFAFNGGPGAASVFLHMGLLGPKRVELSEKVTDAGAGPIEVVENEYWLIDVADLVLVDPIGTGYSRALEGHDDKEFWGIGEDADILARFVRQWLIKHQRLNSPKYLLGESYATIRSAAMARALMQEELGSIALNGLILISAALDFQSLRTMPHNPMVSVGYLPSYAATAWYHGKVSRTQYPDLESLLLEARNFAQQEYLPVLVQGQRVDPGERNRIRARLAQLTGVSESYLEGVDLYMDPSRFVKELLRDRGLTVGRLDSRYTGSDFDSGGERYDYDPSQSAFGPAYSTALLHHLRVELGVDMGHMPYQVLNRSGVKPHWNWKQPDIQRWSGGMNPEWPYFVNVAPFIGDEMRRNSDFRVLLASGIFDLATPFFPVENTMYQKGMLPERVTFTYYESGHMPYIQESTLAKLVEDIRQFIRAGESEP